MIEQKGKNIDKKIMNCKNNYQFDLRIMVKHFTTIHSLPYQKKKWISK